MHSSREKTEAATPRRRERARQEGQIAKSQEIAPAFVFLTAVIVFYLTGSDLFKGIIDFVSTMLVGTIKKEWSAQVFVAYIIEMTSNSIWLLLPLFIITIVVSLGINLLQAGFLFSLKKLEPRFSHLNPMEGLKRRLSLNTFLELLKSLIKVGVVGTIVYITIINQLSSFFHLSSQNLAYIAAHIGRSCITLGAHTACAIVAMAGLDYVMQRWQYERGLRMTRQEVKEERKYEEGDPQIRSRIRSIMYKRSQGRMMEDIPKADVVVTNPTHIAVALRYQRDEMIAPTVVAKGMGFIAERIKTIAREHDIFIIENRLVAQHLFKTVDIGEMIPEELYKAVAEILSYMYRIRPSSKTW